MLTLRHILRLLILSAFALTPYAGAKAQVVQFRSEVTDTSGNPISSIERGAEFIFRMYVQDIRPEPTGVFSAFADVTYDATMFANVGPVDHGDTYDSAQSGALTPGEMNEVGGVDGLIPLGGEEYLVFSVPMVSLDRAGTSVFTPNPADNLVQHPILMYGENMGVASSNQRFLPVSLSVVPEPTGRGQLVFVVPVVWAIWRRKR